MHRRCSRRPAVNAKMAATTMSAASPAAPSNSGFGRLRPPAAGMRPREDGSGTVDFFFLGPCGRGVGGMAADPS